MDTLVVKFSCYKFTLIGSRADLMEIVAVISSTSSQLQSSLEAALTMLYIESGRFDFVLAEIKDRLFKEIQYFHKRLDVRVEAHDLWAEQVFQSIDFDQEMQDWLSRLPK